jgi:hypothetical protein
VHNNFENRTVSDHLKQLKMIDMMDDWAYFSKLAAIAFCIIVVDEWTQAVAISGEVVLAVI